MKLKRCMVCSTLFALIFAAGSGIAVSADKQADDVSVLTFYRDMGKLSVYGNGSKIEADFKNPKEGKASLRIELNTAQWTAAMVRLPKPSALKELRDGGACLAFWIKCDQERPLLKVQLVDSDADGKPVEIFIDLPAYAQLSKKKWEEVKIPLSYFPDKGSYYDGVENKFDELFQWDQVAEVRFQAAPSESEPVVYKFNVDEIVIIK
ncbi:MAG: carbohydrate binding domain-containing protein [Elusimicrobiota bacterium]